MSEEVTKSEVQEANHAPESKKAAEKETTAEKKAKKSLAEIELELKVLQLEEARLAVEERKANLQDVKERLDQRELDRKKNRMKAKTNGMVLRQIAADERAAQKRCTHRKGGQGHQGVVLGQGDDSQYAVLKHTFLNGDTWVRCLRCGKTWKPPIKANFYVDSEGRNVPPSSDEFGSLIIPTNATFSIESHTAALMDYQTALSFPTRNIPSSSYVFKFSDGGQYFRDITVGTSLR